MTGPFQPIRGPKLKSHIKAVELGLHRGFDIHARQPNDLAQVLARSYVALALRMDRKSEQLRRLRGSVQ